MLQSRKRFIGVIQMKKIHFNGNKNIIHEQLRRIREQRNLSQADLAAQMQVLNANLDQQMISKIEHNDRIVTDYELACFCKVLNVSEAELLADFDKFT